MKNFFIQTILFHSFWDVSKYSLANCNLRFRFVIILIQFFFAAGCKWTLAAAKRRMTVFTEIYIFKSLLRKNNASATALRFVYRCLRQFPNYSGIASFFGAMIIFSVIF